MAGRTVQGADWPPEVNGLILALELQRDEALADGAQAYCALQVARLAIDKANAKAAELQKYADYMADAAAVRDPADIVTLEKWRALGAPPLAES